MGKGFSLKGRTGVKECLTFQTPNPLSAVWNAVLHWSTQACPHTDKHVHLSHILASTQVVVIDRIKRLKINANIQAPLRVLLLLLCALRGEKSGFELPSILNSLHLFSHRQLDRGVSPMLGHRSAEDVGN